MMNPTRIAASDNEAGSGSAGAPGTEDQQRGQKPAPFVSATVRSATSTLRVRPDAVRGVPDVPPPRARYVRPSPSACSDAAGRR